MENQQPSINYRSIKKNALKHPVHVGEIYGIYEALEEIKIQTSKCVVTKWKCRNINTDKVILCTNSYLYKIGERVLRRSQELNQSGLRNYLYRNSQNNAKSRGHLFLLSFEEFNRFISQPCHYCGEPPKMVDRELLMKRGDTHQIPISYNGIDRLNPNEDYTIDNCVPCCSTCNYMKHTQQKEDFLKQVEKIYNFSINKGSTTIPKGSTSQANGGGNGGPLTSKVEGEDIVSTSTVM